MRTPKRIQLRRTKGWRKPEGAIVVSRPSKWGNPWTPKNTEHLVVEGGRIVSGRPCTVEECVDEYRKSIETAEFGMTVQDVRDELAGKDLCCWCHLCEVHRDGKPHDVDCPDCKPCHADVLLSMANS